MTKPGNKLLRDEAVVAQNISRAVRHPSLVLRTGALWFKQYDMNGYLSIQVELKGDGSCLVKCGPTVHSKRVRTGTKLATNKLSQAAEGRKRL